MFAGVAVHFLQCEQSGQRAKKLVSASLGLVDFAVRLVDLLLHLLDGQVKYHKRHAYDNFLC